MDSIPNLDLPTLIERLQQAKSIMPEDMNPTVRLELVGNSLFLRFDFFQGSPDYFHLAREISDIHTLQYGTAWTACLDQIHKYTEGLIRERRDKHAKRTG